ncbi:hypothetical protein BS639_22830 [Rouxiella silvae]|uniref:Uncharacterized protein n=1 Tax=Rouxiella silvae TaxID=1646373 RepID=A0ABX3TUW3_9GAMM|nr:hypothetical protein [Rouxiella silvae]ORJ18919.1 hypothetical protein BS639_22830 [Rouxiella silvae]
MKNQAVGVLWFRNVIEYSEYRKLFTDTHTLPESYSEWLLDAEKVIQLYENEEVNIFKVEAEPIDFRCWCILNGQSIDSEGRIAFANAKAQECALKNG